MSPSRWRLELTPHVRQMIRSWELDRGDSFSDTILVEVHLRLDRLQDRPHELLRRAKQPFDGMLYDFKLVDPKNRLCQHFFAFLVRYHADEQTLIIVNAGYLRSFGI